MRTQDKNLVFVCFAQRENSEIINCLKDLKNDYNFDVETHKLGEPCNPKPEYTKKLYIISPEKEEDVKKLLDEHEKYREKIKSETIVLASPFECNKWANCFDAKHCINIKDLNTCRTELKKILEKTFQSGQQVGQEKEIFSTGQCNQGKTEQQYSK